MWDGITTEQQGRSVAIRADIGQNLVDQLVRMLQARSGSGSRPLL
jgi:hypothetical protein